jgi:hypothetical protein
MDESLDPLDRYYYADSLIAEAGRGVQNLYDAGIIEPAPAPVTPSPASASSAPVQYQRLFLGYDGLNAAAQSKARDWFRTQYSDPAGDPALATLQAERSERLRRELALLGLAASNASLGEPNGWSSGRIDLGEVAIVDPASFAAAAKVRAKDLEDEDLDLSGFICYGDGEIQQRHYELKGAQGKVVAFLRDTLQPTARIWGVLARHRNDEEGSVYREAMEDTSALSITDEH